ncbi:YcxB family protein [Undibacterium fentianense]|uniref:YcxB family protein n=1 Tax=Undibacterium fentianense TaxID=2828728 RepID=A0A941E0I3_9BURK|nr:YcxB family protein [Undibacterium fentianense]MBR7800120.1 YcxB family protein [Undibacterium fentianense]
MLAIHTTLTKNDITRAVFVRLTRPRVLFKVWLGWTLFVVVLLAVVRGMPATLIDLFVLSVSAVGGAFFSVLISVIFTLVRIRSAIQLGDGILGDHYYAVTEQGLMERTSVNETLINWSGVKRVERDKQSVLIELVSGAFHLIPKNAFTSIAEENAFVSAIQYYLQGDLQHRVQDNAAGRSK